MLNDKENEYQLNIYKIETNQKLDKKKIILVILIIVAFICVILIQKNISKTIEEYKVYKQYEAQVESINHQAEEKIKAEEAKKEKERQEKLPNLTEAGKENISKIYHSDTKRAFLTFDDGPSSVTSKILDTLKQENIKASFFVLGSNVEARPEMVKRMYDEGHFIGIHGTSHVYSQIYQSPQSVLDEYNMCNEKIKNALGEQEYNPHLFRFPGGLAGGKYAEVKAQAKELLLQNNIEHVDWNALNGDAETNKLSSEFEMKRLQETTAGKNSVVILMHDAQAKSVTADTLPQIISYLKEQGYEFENFYQIIK